jgi:hypothetical protein
MEFFCILGYLLELIIKIWRFEKINKSSNSGEFESFFSMKNPFCIGNRNHIFQVKIWRKFTSKSNIEPHHQGGGQ